MDPLARQRPVEVALAEVEHTAVGADQHVPGTPIDHHAHDVVDVLADPRHRAVEAGAPEGKDASVGADQVIALTVAGGGHGHDVGDVLAEPGGVAIKADIGAMF